MECPSSLSTSARRSRGIGHPGRSVQPPRERRRGKAMNVTATLRQPWLHRRHRELNRWLQLVGGVVVMMAIASVLYVWPLLRSGSGASLAKSLAATENAFAAFILA